MDVVHFLICIKCSRPLRILLYSQFQHTSFHLVFSLLLYSEIQAVITSHLKTGKDNSRNVVYTYLFVVYVTAISVSHTMQRRIIG
jgi:hypothetical protein